VGSQPSCTPTNDDSSTPAQNTGMAMPTWLNMATAAPTGVPALVAA
jgi:hypothetical protein